MKKFFLASLISVGLVLTAHAEQTTAAASTAPAMTEATKGDSTPHSSKRMTKEERLAHSTKEVEDLMASLAEKAKSMTGADKAMSELYMAHAKLELDAAKDVEMKSHALSHINKAKRFLKNALKFTAKGATHDKKTTDVKTTEATESTTKK